MQCSRKSIPLWFAIRGTTLIGASGFALDRFILPRAIDQHRTIGLLSSTPCLIQKRYATAWLTSLSLWHIYKAPPSSPLAPPRGGGAFSAFSGDSANMASKSVTDASLRASGGLFEHVSESTKQLCCISFFLAIRSYLQAHYLL